MYAKVPCYPKGAAVAAQVKVIRHNVSKIDIPDDTSYPFKLEVRLSHPDFMNVAFIMLFGGTEELIVRGKSKRALEKLIKKQKLRTDPRLLSFTLTGPKGVIEKKGR